MQAIGKSTKDLTGQKFGRLTVVGLSHYRVSPPRGKIAIWDVLCECGGQSKQPGTPMKKGVVVSCGCFHREQSARRLIERRPGEKHGQCPKSGSSPAHKSWTAMLSRCRNPTDKDYWKYGGAGITVCARWYEFEAFYADMGDRPPGTTIDRINNAGSYEPGNCRWATPAQQQANRRITKLNADLVRYLREQRSAGRSVLELARETGINDATIHSAVTGKSWKTVL